MIKFEKLSSAIRRIEKENPQSEKSDFSGWYGGHKRKVFLENGQLFLQRGGAPKLKLVKVKDDEYKMVFSMPPGMNYPVSGLKGMKQIK